VVPEGEVEGIVVLRDGARVGRLEPGDSTFTDRSALPATRYSYVVLSVRGGEFLRSEPIRVKTPPAPLSLARLDGVYAIDARSTSHFGFTGVADEFASGWRFRPVCRRGPCTVTFKDAQGNPLSGKLERTRVRYEGTGSSKFGTCGNVSSTGTFTLRLEVVRAKTVRDAWRASKLVGTFRRTRAGTARMRRCGRRLRHHRQADRVRAPATRSSCSRRPSRSASSSAPSSKHLRTR
jgi:hypothetical protein